MNQIKLKKVNSFVNYALTGLKYLLNPLEIFLFAFILMKLYYYHSQVGASSYYKLLVFASIGSVCVVSFWAFLLPGRIKNFALLALDIFLTVLVAADLLYYRYFSDVISMNLIFSQASVVGDVKSSILNLVHLKDLVLLFDFIILAPIAVYLAKTKRKSEKTPYAYHVIKAVVLLTIGVFLASKGINNLVENQPGILKTFYDRVYISQRIGVLNFHAVDIYKFYQARSKGPKVLSEQEKQKVYQFMLEKQNRRPENPKYFGIGKGKNLIVLQMEALQGFVINAKINGKEITPNLNKLAKRSMYFNNYYCETAGGGTSDAEFLANVSLFPVKEGAVFIRYAGNSYDSLPKRMKAEGYGTSVFHAYKAGFWNRSVMYKTLGFDQFINKSNFNEDEVLGMGLSDKSFYKQTLAQLKQQQQPYYAMLISLSSHYPYDNDKKFYSPFDVSPYKNTFFGNYLEAIHYADEALGGFVEQLEKEGMLDNCVLAVYGDHFAISRDQSQDLEKYLQTKFYDYIWIKQQKVPLMIHLPGDKNAGVNPNTGGGIDLMPTLLNLMGVKAEDAPMMGRDLVNDKEGMAIMRHGNFVTNDFVYMASLDKAFGVQKGVPYTLPQLKTKKDMARDSLEMSDKIIEYNMVTEVMKHLADNAKIKTSKTQ